MDFDKTFADPSLEKEGVWVDYRDGSRVKICRLGNPRYQRMLDAKRKPYARLERQGRTNSEIETRILCETMAHTILVDWEGFERGGKTLKYSADAAFELLFRSMDFRNEITALALEEEHFRTEEEDEQVKNS